MNIDKLPKKVQEYIKDLQRQRETAVRVLDDYINDQTPSAFSYQDMECTGEQPGSTLRKRFVQTYKMDIIHCGIKLNVMLRSNAIELKWGTEKFNGDAAFIPQTYQCAKLINKENMRD